MTTVPSVNRIRSPSVGRAGYPSATLTTSQMSSTTERSSSMSGPSAITRMSFSVPDARTNTRPCPVSRSSPARIASRMSGFISQPVRSRTGTFSRSCGYSSITPASSESGLPVSIMTFSTWSAVIIPSPVFVNSPNIRCPDFSPPSIAPRRLISSETYRSPTPARASSMPAVSSASSRPILLITVPTTAFPGRSPLRARWRPQSAITWSPSTRLPLRVGEDRAVGVAVEREADHGVRTGHQLAYPVGVESPAVAVDVRAVRLSVDDRDSRSEFGEEMRGDVGRRSVRAVDGDADAVEPVGERPLEVLDIAVGEEGRAVHPADPQSLGERQLVEPADLRLDLGLDVIGELMAVRAEELDAVVAHRVVGGGDDDAGIGVDQLGEIGDRGGRDDADEMDVDAERADSRRERALEHVAGDPGVAPDEDLGVLMLSAQDVCGRRAEAKREVRAQLGVGDTSDAVCSEQLRMDRSEYNL